jgi:Tfp pilus assembly protein PilN
MNFRPIRLAVALLGDRLAVAALGRGGVEAFTVDAENPGAALRAELDARKLSARAAGFALSRSAVSVKQIELPSVAGDLREMVRFELDRHLPFPADDAAYDLVALPAEPTPEGAPPTGHRVLVAAADRRVVDAALRVAEEARLKPWSLTVASHNLPSLARPPRGARVVWAHRAAGTTDLLLLAGETLLGSRSVPTVDDAGVADEIRRSLVAVRWRSCDAIWLSGDGALEGAPNMGPLTGIGVPVVEPAWTPRARARLRALPEPSGALQLAVAVASGRRVRPLELLPPALRPRRLSRPQAITVTLVAVTALLAILALLAPGWRQQRHLARIDAEIARLDPEVRAVDRVLRDLERKRKLLATVAGVEAGGIRSLPVLRELTEILPNDTWLTTLSLDTKGVELTGQAAAASALIPLLENSPRLERVEFSSPVTRSRENKEQFRIRAAWEPGGAVSTAAPVLPPTPGQTLAPTPSVPPPGAPPRRAVSPGAPAGAAPGQPAPSAPTPPAPGTTR